jgi:hypothetical protein
MATSIHEQLATVDTGSFVLERNGHIPTVEQEAATHYLTELEALADEHGVSTFDIDTPLNRVTDNISRKGYKEVRESKLHPDQKAAFNPSHPAHKTGEGVRKAAGVYLEAIRPLLAEGKEGHVFKPTPEQIKALCDKMSSPDGLNFVFYYAMSKTKSPRRTGSPNNIIDPAEIEMLKQYAIISRAAEAQGIDLRFTIVNEMDVMPNDDPLGLTASEKAVNKAVTSQTLKRFGADHLITVRSLRDSVVEPLGNTFPTQYEQRRAANLQKAQEEVESNALTALRIRCFTFLDCMPDANLEQFGLSPEDIAGIRQQGKDIDLNILPASLTQFLIHRTAEFASIMDLRGLATRNVMEQGLQSEYPEYALNRVNAGVTRNAERWSFKPHPKPSLGRTINPMHGIVLYNGQSGDYIGIAEYAQLERDVIATGKGEIVSIGKKPVFAKLNL